MNDKNIKNVKNYRRTFFAGLLDLEESIINDGTFIDINNELQVYSDDCKTCVNKLLAFVESNGILFNSKINRFISQHFRLTESEMLKIWNYDNPEANRTNIRTQLKRSSDIYYKFFGTEIFTLLLLNDTNYIIKLNLILDSCRMGDVSFFDLFLDSFEISKYERLTEEHTYNKEDLYDTFLILYYYSKQRFEINKSLLDMDKVLYIYDIMNKAIVKDQYINQEKLDLLAIYNSIISEYESAKDIKFIEVHKSKDKESSTTKETVNKVLYDTLQNKYNELEKSYNELVESEYVDNNTENVTINIGLYNELKDKYCELEKSYNELQQSINETNFTKNETDEKDQYSILKDQYNELEKSYNELQQSYNELLNSKTENSLKEYSVEETNVEETNVEETNVEETNVEETNVADNNWVVSDLTFSDRGISLIENSIPIDWKCDINKEFKQQDYQYGLLVLRSLCEKTYFVNMQTAINKMIEQKIDTDIFVKLLYILRNNEDCFDMFCDFCEFGAKFIEERPKQERTEEENNIYNMYQLKLLEKMGMPITDTMKLRMISDEDFESLLEDFYNN